LGTDGTIVGEGGSAGKFIELTDAPQHYANAAQKLVRVNATQTGVEFIDDTAIRPALDLSSYQATVNELLSDYTAISNDMSTLRTLADAMADMQMSVSPAYQNVYAWQLVREINLNGSALPTTVIPWNNEPVKIEFEGWTKNNINLPNNAGTGATVLQLAPANVWNNVVPIR
jgi:hypothetical protein